MKRMINLHSVFRQDKAALRHDIRNLEMQVQQSRSLLKMEREATLMLLRQEHERAVNVLSEESRREGQMLYFKKRDASVSQEEIERILARYHRTCEDERAARLKENDRYLKDVEQVHRNYLLKRGNLDRKAQTERAALEKRFAEIRDRFAKDEAAIIETWRKEKALAEVEKGGER